jgi:hypothetical protein
LEEGECLELGRKRTEEPMEGDQREDQTEIRAQAPARTIIERLEARGGQVCRSGSCVQGKRTFLRGPLANSRGCNGSI